MCGKGSPIFYWKVTGADSDCGARRPPARAFFRWANNAHRGERRQNRYLGPCCAVVNAFFPQLGASGRAWGSGAAWLRLTVFVVSRLQANSAQENARKRERDQGAHESARRRRRRRENRKALLEGGFRGTVLRQRLTRGEWVKREEVTPLSPQFVVTASSRIHSRTAGLCGCCRQVSLLSLRLPPSRSPSPRTRVPRCTHITDSVERSDSRLTASLPCAHRRGYGGRGRLTGHAPA